MNLLFLNHRPFKNTKDGVLFPQSDWTREPFLQPEIYCYSNYWNVATSELDIRNSYLAISPSSSTKIISIIIMIINNSSIITITWKCPAPGSSQWLDRTPVRTQGLSHSRPCLETCWRKYNARVIVCSDINQLTF